MKRLTLKARAGDLPLGWEAGERLAGTKREGPYRVGSSAPVGKALAAKLRELGPGRKVVTVEGYFQPSDEGTLDQLPMFTRRTEVSLHLDPQSLGFVVHELVRRFRESEKARVGGDDTPKEAYVTGIYIRTVEGPIGTRRVVQETKRKKVKGKLRTVTESVVRTQRVVYQDTRTGQLVSRETWERSRRAIRANATRKGTSPKTGRYVRRVG